VPSGAVVLVVPFAAVVVVVVAVATTVVVVLEGSDVTEELFAVDPPPDPPDGPMGGVADEAGDVNDVVVDGEAALAFDPLGPTFESPCVDCVVGLLDVPGGRFVRCDTTAVAETAGGWYVA